MERQARISELFQGAISVDATERERSLAAAVREDLGSELRQLLAADQRNNDGFLSHSFIDSFTDEAYEAEVGGLSPGAELGRCRVRRLLFRGDKSAVYLAEQPATQRLVAIKVLHSGGAGEILVRFEQERRIVAMLCHKNIAALYDAGASDDGNAYFVMEYVDGRPITEFCESEGLSTAERLGLFLQLCAAVGHAHHHGVIHRDLKPSNILVTQSPRGPVVKVIDFGIAKLDRPASHRATQHGQVIGTIGYMAPEQIERGGSFADTRSDCYSLGVVLYEMLSGVPAVPTQGAGPLTVLSRIATQEPERISRVQPRLRGDLERVVEMALRKDIGSRYQNVEALRADVERYLEGRPVAARGSRPLYVLGRLILRNRRWAAAALALLVVIAVSGVRRWNAELAKFDLAVSISQAWVEESSVMARTVEAHARRGPLLARLDEQSATLFSQAPTHAGVMTLRADVLAAVGDMELERGDTAAARVRFEHVLDLRSRLVRRFPTDLTRACALSVAIVRMGDIALHTGDVDTALCRYTEALAIDGRLVAGHPTSARPHTLLAWSYDRLASLADRGGDAARADALYRLSLACFQTLVTLEESADARRGLSVAYQHTGAMAGRRGDSATVRRHAGLAKIEATKAAALSPMDRLAVWNELWARQFFFEAARQEMDAAQERGFAVETVEIARRLVDRDPSDCLGRENLALALVHAARCAELAGDDAEARRLRLLEVNERNIILASQPRHPDAVSAQRAAEEASRRP